MRKLLKAAGNACIRRQDEGSRRQRTGVQVQGRAQALAQAQRDPDQGAGGLAQPRRPRGRLRPSPRHGRRRRHHRRPGMRRRGRGGRRRRQGLQAGRSGHELGRGRLRRIRRHRRRPRPQDPRQQHDLRAGRLHAGGGADHAQRAGRRRPPEEGRIGADPGRQLGRRPARHADRQAHGRLDRHGHLDQRRPPRAAQGVRLRPGARHARSQMAGQGQGGDRRQGRRPDRRPGLGRRR